MHRFRILTILPLLLVIAMAAPKTVSDVTAPNTGEPESYSHDAAHSYVGFSVKHMVISTIKGHFRDYSVSVIYDPDNLEHSSVVVSIEIASIDSDNEQRDGHLQSAEFFDVENYPKITFKSERIERNEEGLVAIGELTMRGVTSQIELPFELIGPVTGMQGEKRYGIDASIKLNRQDYGISWNRALDTGGLMVSNMVTIEIHLELVQDQG